MVTTNADSQFAETSIRLWRNGLDLHVVGGFLGSGKTTAIINALKTLMANDYRVGVITNDKGRYLVDTAFFGTANVPTAEVPGGCFRCNYGDFQERIAQLQQSARPDVLFAESVGSCVDLAGPVLTPLAALLGENGARVTYSVFAEIRLLRRYLAGLDLPFSDSITYIFVQQLEEANILVINKVDLLPEQADAILEQAHRRFPQKTLLLQNSLTPAGVAPWLAVLQEEHPLPPALTVDYDKYGAGAAELAWFDERLTFAPPVGQERTVVINIITAILEGLRQCNAPVAHLKFFIGDAGTGIKLSFTTLDRIDWEQKLPQQLPSPVTLLINARIEMEAARLRALISQALHDALTDEGVAYQSTGMNAFAPQVPK